jgi:hypothetical protein
MQVASWWYSHDGLIGLLLEVAVQSGAELWAWPLVHAIKLFLTRSDLNTSINIVSSQWAGAVDVPLLEDSILDLGITTSEIIEGLDVWLRAIGGKSEVKE